MLGSRHRCGDQSSEVNKTAAGTWVAATRRSSSPARPPPFAPQARLKGTKLPLGVGLSEGRVTLGKGHRSSVDLIRPVPGDVSFDHSVKVVPARFPT